jgi:hypothetical protein
MVVLCRAKAIRENWAAEIETTTTAMTGKTPRKTLPPGIATVLTTLCVCNIGAHQGFWSRHPLRRLQRHVNWR